MVTCRSSPTFQNVQEMPLPAQLLVCLLRLTSAYLSPVGMPLEAPTLLRLELQKPCRDRERGLVCPSLKQSAPPEALFSVFRSTLLRQVSNQNICLL